MKAAKRIIWIVLTAAVLLAFPVCAHAIGFDAEEIYASVFVIYSGSSLGSGFAIEKDMIVTNAHVLESGALTTAEDYEGNRYKVTPVAWDEELDIALLRAADAEFAPLQPGELSTLSVGDDVYAIGAPNSLAFTLTKGVVSAKNRVVRNHGYIQTDAAINTGNSGGPLLNDAGEVVGVNAYKMNDSEGIGLAIPMDAVLTFLETGVTESAEGAAPGSAAESYIQLYPPESGTSEEIIAQAEKNARLVTVLGIGLGLSALLNAVLIISLVYHRRRPEIPAADPSERTDFDIDILE